MRSGRGSESFWVTTLRQVPILIACLVVVAVLVWLVNDYAVLPDSGP